MEKIGCALNVPSVESKENAPTPVGDAARCPSKSTVVHLVSVPVDPLGVILGSIRAGHVIRREPHSTPTPAGRSLVGLEDISCTVRIGSDSPNEERSIPMHH